MSQKLVVLDDRGHILKKTGMYAGSVAEEKQLRYIFNDSKFIEKEVYIVPALIKIVEEIIDNSVDEAIRTKFEFGNNIKVTMDEKSFRVIDNGRGIPVTKNEDGIYYPKIAWSMARAGSNFEDDKNRITSGSHGIGSMMTNVLATKFIGISQDGKNKITCEWEDNANPDTYKEKVSKSSKKGVEVYSEPDFKRFGRKKFTQDDFDVIKTRLVFLSLTYPEIKLYFNGERIITPKEVEF
jgi:DNA gyrase/topoisomerase IV subunit B